MQKQLTRILLILLFLILVVTIILIIFGKFNIDTANDNALYGIYDSSLAGTSAFYNPLVELLWFSEILSLIIMPVVLWIGRTKLKITTFPWIIISILLVLELTIWPIYMPNNLTQTFSSIFPNFLKEEFRIIITILIGYLVFYTLKQRKKN